MCLGTSLQAVGYEGSFARRASDVDGRGFASRRLWLCCRLRVSVSDVTNRLSARQSVHLQPTISKLLRRGLCHSAATEISNSYTNMAIRHGAKQYRELLIPTQRLSVLHPSDESPPRRNSPSAARSSLVPKSRHWSSSLQVWGRGTTTTSSALSPVWLARSCMESGLDEV